MLSIKKDKSFENFQDKKILVAGGAGFIGSWVCETLLQYGSQITCLDNFSTGLTNNISFSNKNFHLLKGDVESLSFDEKFDIIFHLASRASPDDYQKHPSETLLSNSLGSLKLLEVARKHDATIIYASTSEIYGDGKIIPTPESYWGNVNPIGVRSCYDEGKRFGEALFFAYFRQYSIDTRIMRIFNTYGPRLRPDGAYARAVSRFLLQAMKNEDITVHGDGQQTRSFCHITDTVSGILKVVSNEKCRGEVLNIGNPNEITILDLAKIILQVTESTSKIEFHPRPQDDPQRRCPDISKAKKLLNWQPTVPLVEGLEDTFEWFKKNQIT